MSNPSPSDSTFLLLQKLVRALDEKKVGDLRVLKVSAKSTITDYIVLATGNSEPHLRALRIEVERVLDEQKQPIAGMDVGGYGSGWTVVDAFQIMTHLFTPEQRGNYALEKLWKDAEVINVAKLIEVPKAPAPAKKEKPAVKKVAKPAAKAATKKVTTKKVVAKKSVTQKALPAKKAVAANKAVVKKKK